MNSTDGELQTSPGAACDWLGWFRLSSFPASTHDSPKMFPAKIKHKTLRKGALPACLSVLRSNLSLNGKLSSGVGTEHVELTQIGCLNTLELIGNKSEHKMVWVWSRYLREIKNGGKAMEPFTCGEHVQYCVCMHHSPHCTVKIRASCSSLSDVATRTMIRQVYEIAQH